jgi:membrane protein insertase Oxa1/YidC/SpoIIIJ
VQQSLTPKPTDPNQQMMYKMMKFMPIIFFFFFYNLPSGLVLYWLIRNLAYVGETLWIRRRIRQEEEEGKFDFGKMTLDKILNEQKVTAKKALKNP